jgi:hypothetical protein
MKMYRDMTASEREKIDRQHEWDLEDRKYDAEQRMAIWDSMSPGERAWELEWREQQARMLEKFDRSIYG